MEFSREVLSISRRNWLLAGTAAGFQSKRQTMSWITSSFFIQRRYPDLLLWRVNFWTTHCLLEIVTSHKITVSSSPVRTGDRHKPLKMQCWYCMLHRAMGTLLCKTSVITVDVVPKEDNEWSPMNRIHLGTQYVTLLFAVWWASYHPQWANAALSIHPQRENMCQCVEDENEPAR